MNHWHIFQGHGAGLRARRDPGACRTHCLSQGQGRINQRKKLKSKRSFYALKEKGVKMRLFGVMQQKNLSTDASVENPFFERKMWVWRTSTLTRAGGAAISKVSSYGHTSPYMELPPVWVDTWGVRCHAELLVGPVSRRTKLIAIVYSNCYWGFKNVHKEQNVPTFLFSS